MIFSKMLIAGQNNCISIEDYLVFRSASTNQGKTGTITWKDKGLGMSNFCAIVDRVHYHICD